MKLCKIKLEYWLYAAAFLLALITRLVGIERFPLTDSEANLALQALALARGQAPVLGPHPLYLVLTTLWFYVFSATNWAARFWPALVGSALVLLPLLFRDRLGRFAAVLLAFFLAFDPGLLTISHQADSTVLALFFTMLAFGLWLRGKETYAGIAAGLALLGGPSVWPGLIALLIALWVYHSYQRTTQPPESLEPKSAPMGAQIYPAPQLQAASWRQFFISALATAFFAGTLLFFIPNGLSAAGQSIAVYVKGWTGAIPGLPVGLFMLGLLLYEFFPLILGLWGGVRGWGKNPVDRFLLMWWAIALALALIYPARQLTDLAWSLLPLWGLAARQIIRLTRFPAYDRFAILGQAVLAGILLTFVSMDLVTMANAPTLAMVEYQVRLAGALVLLIASVALIAWGWSRQVALLGLGWGASAVLVVYFLSAGFGAAGLANRAGDELWYGSRWVKGGALLVQTVQNLNNWGPKVPNGQEIVIMNVQSPALNWLLRDQQKVSYASGLASNAAPAIVITPVQPALSLSASYRGEAFVLGEDVAWSQLQTPADWFRWLVFHTANADKTVQEQVILWARSDLFPGGAAQVQPQSSQSGQNNPQ